MIGGYNERIAFVDLSNERVEYEQPDEDVLCRFIGGRGLGGKLLLDLAPRAEALSPSSPFGIFAGPLTGTGVPLANRLTLVFRSPLTRTLAYANTGGYAGAELKLAGLDGLLLIGISGKPRYVVVENAQVMLKEAGELWGLHSCECVKRLREKHGDARVLSIGPAGENLIKYATVVNDSGRSSGVRHGAGCSLGYKKIKAIVIVGSRARRLPVARKPEFRSVVRRLLDKLKSSPLLNRENGLFAVHGTPIAVEPLNSNHALPAFNYRQTHFEGAHNLTGAKMSATLLVGRLTCSGCSVQCRRETATLKKYHFRVEGPDYAQICSLGSNCGLDDLESVAYLNYLCYELGLDPIETGNMLAIYAEATEKGVVPKGLRWGDADRMAELIRLVALRKGEGTFLAEGAEELVRQLGCSELNTAVKGITIQNTDPRVEPAWGLLNATENSGGAVHIWVYPDLVYSFKPLGLRSLLAEDAGHEQLAKMVKWKQDLVAALDSLQVCAFSSMAFEVGDYADALNSVTGWGWSEEDLLAAGERVFNLERYYLNLNLDLPHDTLPSKFLRTPIPDGKHAGRVCDLRPLLTAYYAQRGWVEGKAPHALLKRLGIL